MPLKREDIVKQGRSWVGTQWKNNGRSRQGVDCLGLIYCLRDELGYPIPDYHTEPNAPKLLELTAKHAGKRMNPRDAKPGDIALVMNPDFLLHIVLLSEMFGVLYMIHSAERFKKVIEHRVDSIWRGRIRVCYQFCPEVED